MSIFGKMTVVLAELRANPGSLVVRRPVATKPGPPVSAQPSNQPKLATLEPSGLQRRDYLPANKPFPAAPGASQSSAVQAFLTKVQELSLSRVDGTDDDDRLIAGSQSYVSAGDGDDFVDVWKDSVVDAGNGNDTVRAWSGSAVFGGEGDDLIELGSDGVSDGGSGNDNIRAGKNTISLGGIGDDRIMAGVESKVEGGLGNDKISVGWNGHADGGEGDDFLAAAADAHMDGGDGNDFLYADNGSLAYGGRGEDFIIGTRGSSLSGGAGDDLIMAGHGSTILFNAGDGADTIHAGLDTRIKFGPGLTSEDMQISVKDGVTTISFGDGSDQLRLHGTATLVFSDGARQQVGVEAVDPKAAAPIATSVDTSALWQDADEEANLSFRDS